MEPCKASSLSWFLIFFVAISLYGVRVLSEEHLVKHEEGPVVEKDQRRTLLATEYGVITAIDVKEGPEKPPYHLQFFTLEPNSLFLPVLLHADMVFYVHTGSGKLTWANDGGTSTIPLREGDLCSLNEGSVFYIQSNLEAERRKLRIYAMFTNTEDNTFDPSIGAYSRVSEMVKGFDKKIMQAALMVSEDVIEEVISTSNTPAIVHAVSEKRNVIQELEVSFLKNFLGDGFNSKKLKTYNIFDNDPDFKNHNGWSIAVTKKQLKSLKHTNIGFLMVHLSLGSILAPHWNPKATELSVVLEGGGMVRTVCGSSNDGETECQNTRFKVKEGDAFVVPRFHAMAQMSFNNEPLVFLGFSTSAKKNHPQFLAGEGSVLHVLDKQILATSFGREKEREREEEEEASKEQKKREREREREEEEARRQQQKREKRRQEEKAKREQEEEEVKEQEKAKRAEEAEAQREQEQAKREKEASAQREQQQAKREQEKRERRRQEEKARREHEKREKEAEEERGGEQEEETAIREQEQKQAEREQRKRESRREQEKVKEEEERERGEEPRKSRTAEWEQEEARRQQEERDRRRERESDNKDQSLRISFEGRRVLKIRNV
ncbi:hypothetical protein Fmac_002488 [Flemingia macrophylla]|uniref:Cupin type-1 domain-containing protein n=1 Tax=Flemingia macrophylla TaxID=520843 RepID=A0ABD1NKV0_9FABA